MNDQVLAKRDPTEMLWLEAGGRRFLTLYTPHGTRERQGGAILLHDLAQHPDWPGLIGPLRRGLPAQGWMTLSLQGPLPIEGQRLTLTDEQALYEALKPRIQAALDYFQSQNIFNVVLVAHGWTAAAAAAYLAEGGGGGAVKAFVAVDLRPAAFADPAAAVERLGIPMLDVYSGGPDSPAQVLAGKRAAAAQRAKHKVYRRLELGSTDSRYTGLDGLLNKRIGNWLKRYSSGTEVTVEGAQPEAK